ncbi:MAG: RNA polymerase sigma factor [Actinomycetota bacterium]|nr:RNA polymerase sigma factor [Actinomycetota bacterium]
MATEGSGLRQTSDRELVIAYKAGDRAAYDEMYRRYNARVMSVCTRLLANRQDAEEAAQETFLKAYQALPRFNGQYQLGAWLARIASNVCVDRSRAKARTATTVALPADDGVIDTGAGPEELVTGLDPRVEVTLGELVPIHARALHLRAVEGLSHEEMAGHLEMTPAQVKALLHRARTSFRRVWQKAEGWAFSPVLALVRFMNDRSEAASGAGSNIASAGYSFSPMLAERIVVSAAIVATAFSGLPTSSSTDAGAPSERRNRPAISWDQPAAAEHGLSKVQIPVTTRHDRADDVAEEKAAVADADPADALIEEITKTVDQDPPPVKEKDEEDDDDDDDEDPTGGGAPSSKVVLEKVREVIEGVQP